MRQTSALDRSKAIARGLAFIYRTACDAENFACYGFDYLACFCGVALTSKDPALRASARELGQRLALRWRKVNHGLAPDADADDIAQFVSARDAVDRLGFPDAQVRSQIQKAAAKFHARDYFWFDPVVEAPPADVPQTCDCGCENERGRRICAGCKHALMMMSRYEVWVVALIRSYMGQRYGVQLGARYFDVLKWLPSMRPYPSVEKLDDDSLQAAYAVTHVVYTLNDYSVNKLLPRWLPLEFAYLKASLRQFTSAQDSETVGEILDALKSFGLTRRNSLIRDGESFLLSQQNADGSWGELDSDDAYDRYHPTWTAIDGLRDYKWKGVGVSFPEAQSLLSKIK